MRINATSLVVLKMETLLIAFTKQTDYGLIALHFLAARFYEDRATNARTIAQECLLPSELLAKTMQLLAKNGLVESKNGPKGGYVLARHPSSITVAEVIRAIEGPIAIAGCQISNASNCEQYRNCSIFHPMGQLQGRINELLEEMTIFDLAGMPAGEIK